MVVETVPSKMKPAGRVVLGGVAVLIAFAVIAIGWGGVQRLHHTKEWVPTPHVLATGQAAGIAWTLTTEKNQDGMVCMGAAYAATAQSGKEVDDAADNSASACGFDPKVPGSNNSFSLDLPHGAVLNAGPLPPNAAGLRSTTGVLVPAKTFQDRGYPLKKYWVSTTISEGVPVDKNGNTLPIQTFSGDS